MPPAGFEPAISASEGQQIHVSDRAATGIGSRAINRVKKQHPCDGLWVLSCRKMGRDSVVGIATGYGLVGPEIEARWRRDRPWCPPSLQYYGYRVIFGGTAAGTWRWRLTPSRVKGKERLELYLYSPSASVWPGLGWYLASFSSEERNSHAVSNKPLTNDHKSHATARKPPEGDSKYSITYKQCLTQRWPGCSGHGPGGH